MIIKAAVIFFLSGTQTWCWHLYPFLTWETSPVSNKSLFVSAEESRGRQFREDHGLGAGALVTHPLHNAQHGATAALLQCPQPSLQQQSHKPVRRTLREPCSLLKLLPKQGHEAREQQSILQQSQAKNWRDDREGFSGRSHKNLTTTSGSPELHWKCNYLKHTALSCIVSFSFIYMYVTKHSSGCI